MKRVLVFIYLFSYPAFSQVPMNYYSSAAGLTGSQLVTALHNIIKDHNIIPAANIPAAIQRIDKKSDSKVWDLYGYVPNGPQNYEYDFVTMACGTPTVEGDCYDIEYLWPKSWFNNDAIASTDLHNIFPVDGYVRSKRGLFPFGTASTASYTSLNWCKLGMCGDNGYTGTVFEPNNDVKGDIARAFFYMSIRYYSESFSWGNSAATNLSGILPWQLSVFLSWNHTDPVSAKEIARNDSIYYKFQINRNPFIDHPQFADSIWTAYIGLNELTDVKEKYTIFPNPTNKGQTQITGLHQGDKIELFNALGELIVEHKSESEFVQLDLSSKPTGVYMLVVRTKFKSHSYKLANAP